MNTKTTKADAAYMAALFNKTSARIDEQRRIAARTKRFGKHVAKYAKAEKGAWGVFHALCRAAFTIAKDKADTLPLDLLCAALPKRERADFIRYVAMCGKVRFDGDKESPAAPGIGGRFLLTGKKAKGDWLAHDAIPPFRDFERVKKAGGRSAAPKTEIDKIRALATKALDGADMAAAALVIQALDGKTDAGRVEQIQRDMRLAVAKEREHSLALAEKARAALSKARQFEHRCELLTAETGALYGQLAALREQLAAIQAAPAKPAKRKAA